MLPSYDYNKLVSAQHSFFKTYRPWIEHVPKIGPRNWKGLKFHGCGDIFLSFLLNGQDIKLPWLSEVASLWPEEKPTWRQGRH